MKTNIGTLDRALRIGIGLLLLTLTLTEMIGRGLSRRMP